MHGLLIASPQLEEQRAAHAQQMQQLEAEYEAKIVAARERLETLLKVSKQERRLATIVCRSSCYCTRARRARRNRSSADTWKSDVRKGRQSSFNWSAALLVRLACRITLLMKGTLSAHTITCLLEPRADSAARAGNPTHGRV